MNNLKKRTLSGMAFVAITITCIMLGASTYCMLFSIITALLLNEFNSLLQQHNLAYVNNTISIISGVYLFIAFFLFSNGSAGISVFAPYILSLAFIPISGLYIKQQNPFTCWAYTFAGQLYIALPIALTNVLAFNQIYSPTLPLAIFALLWLNDTGAFCFGCSLRRKIPYKLFPSVSPNKSWIGSIGGGITVLIGAVIFHSITRENSILFWLGLGAIISIAGTLGDLVESQLKRQLGIKDSGHFMPGHGGILDRFDSALITIPIAVVYITLWGI